MFQRRYSHLFNLLIAEISPRCFYQSVYLGALINNILFKKYIIWDILNKMILHHINGIDDHYLMSFTHDSA